MDIRGKKVLVFGSGISGEGSCRLLLEKGAEVVLYDGNEKLCADEIEAKISEYYAAQKAAAERAAQASQSSSSSSSSSSSDSSSSSSSDSGN